MIGGLFAAFAGLALTASTGIGTPVPGPYTLESVAAIVLGGVSLAGGRGGVIGPIIAVLILQLIRTDMTFLNIDPNLAFVVQGVILIGVVMSAASSRSGGCGRERRGRHVAHGRARQTWRGLFRDRPVIPLTGLLLVLVVVIELADPGIVGPSWAGVILRQSVPLAILAGCQTLTMLTGGIDLSVGAVASMAGFVDGDARQQLGPPGRDHRRRSSSPRSSA